MASTRPTSGPPAAAHDDSSDSMSLQAQVAQHTQLQWWWKQGAVHSIVPCKQTKALSRPMLGRESTAASRSAPVAAAAATPRGKSVESRMAYSKAAVQANRLLRGCACFPMVHIRYKQQPSHGICNKAAAAAA
jgi:hypothetical protein